jgi:transcription initiation factor TFIID TATA-box-binding protein
MVEVKIVNVVATASIGQIVDFNELVKCKEIIYSTTTYGGRVAYFKTEKMQGKVSIFLSGKMISVGTKSESEAFSELAFVMKYLATEGLVKKVELSPKIQNLVIVADFGHQINLEDFSEKTSAIYEPEQFPGSILRIKEPFKASILIFASGKTVITGLKSSENIEPVIQKMTELLAFQK